MATFDLALAKTLAHEGGYSNNPNDKGGETFCGISRKYWPEWSGWAILDGARESGVSIESFSKRTSVFVDMHVSPFYRHNFWLPIHGDEIESQEIADMVFDCSVNPNPKAAVTFAQTAHNKIFKESKYIIDVDGIFGADTLHALNSIEHPDHIGWFVDAMDGQRKKYYLKSIQRRHENAVFAGGWADR